MRSATGRRQFYRCRIARAESAATLLTQQFQGASGRKTLTSKGYAPQILKDRPTPSRIQTGASQYADHAPAQRRKRPSSAATPAPGTAPAR